MSKSSSPLETARAGATGALPIAALGGALLWGTAKLAAPTTAPSDIDSAVTAGVWWLLAATLAWLTISVFVLRAAEASTRRWRIARFAMPGSRSIARALLSIGVLTASACSTDTDAAPRLYAVDSPVEDAAAPQETVIPDVVTTAPAVSVVPQVEVAPPGHSPRNEPPPLEMGVEPHPLLVGDEPTSSIPSTPTTHTVEQGDNLWAIAADHLAEVSGSSPTADEVANYWRLLIAENEADLASGEPNLIHPGEVLRLPDAA